MACLLFANPAPPGQLLADELRGNRKGAGDGKRGDRGESVFGTLQSRATQLFGGAQLQGSIGAIVEEGAVTHDVFHSAQVAHSRRVETHSDSAASFYYPGVFHSALGCARPAAIDACAHSVSIQLEE